MTRRPSYATLYPYTTLFRSRGGGRSILPSTIPCAPPAQEPGEPNALVDDRAPREADDLRGYRARDPPERARPGNGVRSEEHTSELQSRGHLVCRLLLEKKNT